MDWDQYFKEGCQWVAKKSKDKSTKVGCIIVGPEKEIRSTGYNGFVRGGDDTKEDWYLRPKKYSVTCDAERNAIYNAARMGVSIKDCTAYITWPPCHNCAIALAQSGIIEVVVCNQVEEEAKERWTESMKVGEEILREAKVIVRYLSPIEEE